MPDPDLTPNLLDYSPEHLAQRFQTLRAEFDQNLQAASTPEELEEVRLRWEGRKQGRLTLLSSLWLKEAPADKKKKIGQRFNALKEHIVSELQRASGSGGQAVLDAETIDITQPGTRRRLGAEHPLIKTWNEIVTIFQAMGYSVGVGPEVETDYYNFESLNFPPGHPARDTQDTLVIAGQERRPLRDRLLMRTHTSPVQIRTMEQQPPPVRIVIPGKVHRNDAADATHSPIFHQVEGLCVDTNITFSDLKGTLDHFMKALFGSSVKTRFFPSFFPFTEPSADVQISCPFCGGKGCRKCKHSGWIELLGCGMVDPAVFGFVQQKQPAYDPKKISGFAFGMGIDRVAMMKYGISDISLMYSGDLRFLEQFV
jgi:phenylalanyl-tRNA synthetase alpha chain